MKYSRELRTGPDGLRVARLEQRHVARDAALGGRLPHDVGRRQAGLRPGVELVVDHHRDHVAVRDRRLDRHAGERRRDEARRRHRAWAWAAASGSAAAVGAALGRSLGVGEAVGLRRARATATGTARLDAIARPARGRASGRDPPATMPTARPTPSASATDEPRQAPRFIASAGRTRAGARDGPRATPIGPGLASETTRMGAGRADPRSAREDAAVRETASTRASDASAPPADAEGGASAPTTAATPIRRPPRRRPQASSAAAEAAAPLDGRSRRGRRWPHRRDARRPPPRPTTPSPRPTATSADRRRSCDRARRHRRGDRRQRRGPPRRHRRRWRPRTCSSSGAASARRGRTRVERRVRERRGGAGGEVRVTPGLRRAPSSPARRPSSRAIARTRHRPAGDDQPAVGGRWC